MGNYCRDASPFCLNAALKFISLCRFQKLSFSRSTLWAALLIASAHGGYVTMYEEDIDLELEVSRLSFVLFCRNSKHSRKTVDSCLFFQDVAAWTRHLSSFSVSMSMFTPSLVPIVTAAPVTTPSPVTDPISTAAPVTAAPVTNPEPTTAPSTQPSNGDDSSNAPSTPPDNDDDTSNDVPMPGTGLWKGKEIGRDKHDDKVGNGGNDGTKGEVRATRAKGGRRTGRR